jgi:hypothetical protein
MTSHSSPSHRSSGDSCVSSSPDLVATLPARRSLRRPVVIRRSWVRAVVTAMDPRDDVASGATTGRASASPDRRAA